LSNYIGKTPVIGNFVKLDAISVVNGQASYTMQNGGANFTEYNNVNQFLVSLNGILQSPTTSFSVSGSTISFASNLQTGDVIDHIIVLGNTLDVGVPSDNTVTATKLNNDIISGLTELASEPADTDEFLVSDAGTIKRIDYSLIKPSTPHMVKLSTQTASGDSSIDFTSGIDSTYQQYHFEFTEINLATDGAEFQFQADTGTNTNYNLTITSIVYHAENSEGGGGGSLTYSTARDQSQGTAFQDLFPDAGNGTDESAFGYLRVQNPSSSTYTKNFMSRMDGYHQNNLAFNMVVGGYFNTTTPITRFRFKSSSGNFDGRITMYGVNA
jgi:hypothetical protein